MDLSLQCISYSLSFQMRVFCVYTASVPPWSLGCIRDKYFVLLTHWYDVSDFCSSNIHSSLLFFVWQYISILNTLNMTELCDL